MYLLDTNVISELRKAKSGRANNKVVQWASAVDVELLYTSSITLLEIEIGVRRLERKDSAQGAVLRNWFDSQVLPVFSGRILAFDTDAALTCAPLHVPNRRPDRDSMIAAIAINHRFAVVTRNDCDFQQLGVEIVNPWQ